MQASAKILPFQPANDVARPAKAKRKVSLVILPAREPKPIWKWATACFLLLSLGMMGLTLWLLHRGSAPPNIIIAPMVSLADMPLDRLVVKPKAPSQTKTASVQPQAPIAPAPTPAPAPMTLTDIVLPASDLKPAEPPVDSAVDAIATNIANLPAIQPEKEVHVHVVAEAKNSADNLLAEAAAAVAADRYHDAVALYERVLAMNAYNHDALTGRIYALAKTGATREAIVASRHLLTLYPHDDVTEANLSRLLDDSGDTEGAIRALDHAARDAPLNLNYRLSLASLYDRNHHAADALMLYRQVVTAADQQDDAHLPIAAIRQRIHYLESLGAESSGEADATSGAPSTTRPVAP